MLHHQPVVHSSHQPYYHQSSENITPERLKLKQLKHRVATPKPVIHPFFLSSHEQQHAPPPPFNHDFVPFVKYPPEYMEPYQTEPYTISTPNKDQNYYYVNHQPPQPFDIHPHHFEQHLDHHEMIIQPSNPPQSFNHQQLIDDQLDEFNIDQQFQSAFPIGSVPGVVKQVLGRDDIHSEKESTLNITTVNRPLSLDPQLNTPFKKFIAKEEDLKMGEKIILIEDESESSEIEDESEVSSIKLEDPSFVIEPGKVYVIDDSDDEDVTSSNEQEDHQSDNTDEQKEDSYEQENQEERVESEDEESFHLISESIVHEQTLPTQPKSPEHIKSSLEIDQHNARTNLYHWSYVFQYKPKDELTVSILGKTNIDGNRNFTTSPIVHRFNSDTVLTLSGTKYVLTSSFDSLRNQENSTTVSADFLKQFTASLDGPFPKNWRELIEKEFKRLEEPILGPVESSNNFQNENNFDYQIDETNASLKQDNSSKIEEPTTKKKRNSRNKIFEDPPQKPSKTKKKRRKKYDTSSDEDEDTEYAESPQPENKKRKSIQQTLSNSFTKKADNSMSLTDELKSTMLGWKKRSHTSSPPKIPLDSIREIHHETNNDLEDYKINQLREEPQKYENRIDYFKEDFFNEIGGLSQGEEEVNERYNEIQDESIYEEKEPTPKKKTKRKTRRKTRETVENSNIVEQDLDLSIPKVIIDTQFFPKTRKKRKTKTVSMDTIQKAWFGDLEE
ncbi:predicted protein [Naegleria gruberi]|uniref:Predicted protein n=1 Tax=Naegleria gruberi TaxID=5762 RepID=D2UZX8_NAEGR|nr:uncharacterized protein NAEGRDRAFT_45577 [Naegleria gruberi]EFC50013.1 predicted protein [Naegleria gruberi]|eukprot:XP_002682757.1 predicted protein [Naegleria gruberi strain NEG-M]